MQINQSGIDLIMRHEGCCLKAYKDIVGVLTIGWGHTGPDVTEGLIIDSTKANELLHEDLKRFEEGVTKLVKIELNANQFSALVSFAFNLGLGALGGSTLLKLVNKESFDLASKEFGKWNHNGGVVIPGLTNRRKDEQVLFETKV